jgi:hypothetical protein
MPHALVRLGAVEAADVLGQDALEVALVEDVIQRLASDTPGEPLADGIGRRSRIGVWITADANTHGRPGGNLGGWRARTVCTRDVGVEGARRGRRPADRAAGAASGSDSMLPSSASVAATLSGRDQVRLPHEPTPSCLRR